LSRLCCVSALSYSPVLGDDGDSGTSGRPGRRQRELRDLEPERPDDLDHHNPSSASSSSANLEQTLSDIRNYLRLLTAAPGSDGDIGVRQGAGMSHHDLVVGEWQRVALVIDRLSFMLFSLISVIVTFALYAR